ncbi:MAG: tRNA lysidine(34) synthetase TilS [Actinomycetota bacterium]|nr:tRNA lysidine(34) synthetase TilS [Actinomycetota bacterium]
MGQPPIEVAAVRVAVRRALTDLPAGALVLVGCSGGADSLALAAATAFEARRAAWRAGLVTVDHGLQPDSAAQAERVRGWAVRAGFDPVEVAAVTVGRAGGPEAAARAARYAALDGVADQWGAAAILLGHTLDDQAETVLLALARGSGARSLSGMASTRGRYRRPLLGVSRAVTVAACAGEGIDHWQDPHNADTTYARVRVRAVLRALEEAAPGATDGLARSAALLRADADALDEIAQLAGVALATPDGTLSCEELAELRPAVRSRVLRAAALAAGAPAGALTAAHLAAVDALVVHWCGQGAVSLPGGVQAARRSGRLAFDTPPR